MLGTAQHSSTLHIPLNSINDGKDEPATTPFLKSLNTPEKPSVLRRRKRPKFSRIASKYWLLEFLWATLSLACLLAIVAVLHAFNDQTVLT